MWPSFSLPDSATRALHSIRSLAAQSVHVVSDSEDLEDEVVSNTQSCQNSDPCAIGKNLHRIIPAERWCVNREDFDGFVNEVRKCHALGDIQNDVDPNTGLANPHHDDPKIGPNAHVVNKYVIKPATFKSGGASWALTKHKDGLPVDFFVTHNWQEGIYEFYHKVTKSWPIGLLHMWCCFLANPQSWPVEDLKYLLGSEPDLSDSPFARALNAKSCQMMLVVPNSVESIYVRLWCVEEARRAIHLKLPVWVATDCGILHWPLKCNSVQEASRLVASNSLRRLSVWSEETIEAKDSAELQLAASFTSVKDAHCTDPNDEKRIRDSIIGQEDVIDSVIRDLVSVGQWLPPYLASPRGVCAEPPRVEDNRLDGLSNDRATETRAKVPSTLNQDCRHESVDYLVVHNILMAARLESYSDAAKQWFDTADVIETLTIPVAEDMANSLGLKPLERKRLLRVVQDHLSPTGTLLSEPLLSISSGTSSAGSIVVNGFTSPSSQACSSASPSEARVTSGITRMTSGTLKRW